MEKVTIHIYYQGHSKPAGQSVHCEWNSRQVVPLLDAEEGILHLSHPWCLPMGLGRQSGSIFSPLLGSVPHVPLSAFHNQINISTLAELFPSALRNSGLMARLPQLLLWDERSVRP